MKMPKKENFTAPFPSRRHWTMLTSKPTNFWWSVLAWTSESPPTAVFVLHFYICAGPCLSVSTGKTKHCLKAQSLMIPFVETILRPPNLCDNSCLFCYRSAQTTQWWIDLKQNSQENKWSCLCFCKCGSVSLECRLNVGVKVKVK